MRDLDEIDVEILRLLAEDGRRPYSDIADKVDLSPPAVSDRVERLSERGVISRFTVDIDRSRLREARPVLVTVDVTPTEVDAVREALTDSPVVEHAFVTANSRVVFHADAPDNVREWVLSTLPMESVREYRVEPVSAIDRTVGLGAADLSLVCDECDNTVTSEGVTARVGNELHQFCCPSCEARFRDRYEELAEAADD
jgi:DNA-binding Lrp family transcriptional regulator